MIFTPGMQCSITAYGDQLFEEGVKIATAHQPMIKQVIKNFIFLHYKYCAGEAELDSLDPGSLAGTVMDYLML